MRFPSSRPAATVAALALGLMSLLPAGGASAAKPHAGHQALARSDAEALRTAMRGLWHDHVLWTRLYIVSAVADLPDLGATTERLLRNQTDIGNAVKPFYGDAAGEQLTALLRTHILGAAELVTAARLDDAARVEAAKKAWIVNGDEISAFLSAANPGHWPLDDMRSMMRTHLDLTLAEAVSQLQGRYAESVADYDRAQDEILEMADMLSDGIIRQFPRRFARKVS